MKVADFLSKNNEVVIRRFVSKLKDGEVFKSSEIYGEIKKIYGETKLTPNMCKHYMIKLNVPCIRVGKTYHWGTQKTINQLKEIQ